MEQFTVFIICLGLATFLAGEVLFRRQRRDDPKRPLSSWLNRLSISDGPVARCRPVPDRGLVREGERAEDSGDTFPGDSGRIN